MEYPLLLVKIQRYCAYQERCSAEVIQKLHQLGALKDDLKKILHELKVNSFLNDERFAISYVESKFNQKKWGANKIALHLKQKGFSPEIISKSLATISDSDISNTLSALYEKKWASLSTENNIIKRKQKTLRYLLSKGYTYNQLNSLLRLDD